MNKGLLLCIFLIIVLIFLSINLYEDSPKKELFENIDTLKNVSLSSGGKYITLQNKFLKLTGESSQKEIFEMIYEPEEKAIYLKDSQERYVSIIFTVLHKEEYNVMVVDDGIPGNQTRLKVCKNAHGIFIKFYNGMYLCYDSLDQLFAAKNKAKILYIKITSESTQ